MKRRDFFKNMAKISGLAIAAPALISAVTGHVALAEEGRRKKSGDTGAAMVDPNSQNAKNVGYVEDAAKSPKAAGNTCATCAIFVKTENKNGKEAGTCPIFPNQFVSAKGFCNSWAKKT